MGRVALFLLPWNRNTVVGVMKMRVDHIVAETN